MWCQCVGWMILYQILKYYHWTLREVKLVPSFTSTSSPEGALSSVLMSDSHVALLPKHLYKYMYKSTLRISSLLHRCATFASLNWSWHCAASVHAFKEHAAIVQFKVCLFHCTLQLMTLPFLEKIGLCFYLTGVVKVNSEPEPNH